MDTREEREAFHKKILTIDALAADAEALVSTLVEKTGSLPRHISFTNIKGDMETTAVLTNRISEIAMQLRYWRAQITYPNVPFDEDEA